MRNAAEAQKTFDEASTLLGQGKFKEARDLLLDLQKDGYTSVGTEVNLGRADVETGNIGLGIVHIANGVALDRFDFQAHDDLALAQSKVDGGVGVPMKHPAEWGNSVSSYLRPAESLFAASTLLAGILIIRLYKKISRGFHIGGGILIALFLIFSVFGHLGKSLAVLKSDTDLRTAPLASAEVSSPLKSGTRLRVIRKSGDFAEVERTGSFRGWVSAADLESTPF